MTHKNRINMYEGLASYFLPPGVLEYFDNKDGHGGKGSVVAVVKGTNPCDVLKVLMQLLGSERNKVKSVTMDLSDSMRAIIKGAFPKAMAIRDCFHVVRRGEEACEEIRLRLKRDAVRKLKKKKGTLDVL